MTEDDETKITLILPQFERAKDAPAIASPPEDLAAWYALSTLDETALREMGFGRWCDAREPDWPYDRTLMLIPGEWYEHIPNGYVVVDANGKAAVFSKATHSNDIRYGCLAYGVLAAVLP